jgi:predicted nucleotidyltransferase
MDSNILSIILYGSHARHDHDDASDYDICVITRDRTTKEVTVEDLREVISPFISSRINITSYSDAVVSSMLRHGSLFLWHLKLEGELLYGERYFNDKVSKLEQFKTHFEEITYHKELFQDLMTSWKRLSMVNELDLSILFTIARNTCMVLSHLAGKPSFGRLSVFYCAKELFPHLPITVDKYVCLSRWKLLYERESEPSMPLPTTEEYDDIISDIDILLLFALKKTQNV